jgi:hypothetical protein
MCDTALRGEGLRVAGGDAYQMVDDLRPRKAIAARRINCRTKPVSVIQRIAFRKQTLHVLPLGRAGWRECAGAFESCVRENSISDK